VQKVENYFFFFFHIQKMERALDYYQEALMMRTLITNTQVYVLQRNNAVKTLQRWYRNKLQNIIRIWEDDVDEIYCEEEREIKVEFCLGTYKTCIVYFNEYGKQIGLKVEERDPKTGELSVTAGGWEKLYINGYEDESNQVIIALQPPSDNWYEETIETAEYS